MGPQIGIQRLVLKNLDRLVAKLNTSLLVDRPSQRDSGESTNAYHSPKPLQKKDRQPLDSTGGFIG